MTHRLLILASIAVVPATMLTAQVERITVRMAPAPNQTLHLRATQDMVMATEAEAPAADARPIPPMNMRMHTVVDTTSTVGPTDHDGRYSATMTIDTISATATMNGREMPLPSATSEAVKPAITFSYDGEGKVIDIATASPPGASAALDSAKQILTRAFATVAPLTLSVGESVTVPTALNLPLPTGGPAIPLGITGETRYTLTSVTFDGADRIAHLTLHTTGTMSPGSPSAVPAGSPFTFDMTTTGDGKTDVNVDRGSVLHAEQRSTIDGTLRSGPAGHEMPNMRMHATFTIVSDVVK